MFNAKELSNRCRDNRHGEVDQAMKGLSDEGRGGGSVQTEEREGVNGVVT